MCADMQISYVPRRERRVARISAGLAAVLAGAMPSATLRRSEDILPWRSRAEAPGLVDEVPGKRARRRNRGRREQFGRDLRARRAEFIAAVNHYVYQRASLKGLMECEGELLNETAAAVSGEERRIIKHIGAAAAAESRARKAAARVGPELARKLKLAGNKDAGDAVTRMTGFLERDSWGDVFRSRAGMFGALGAGDAGDWRRCVYDVV